MNKENLLVAVGVLAVIAIGVASWIYFHPSKVNSFAACLRAGYRIIETFPRQCVIPEGAILMELVSTPPEFNIEDTAIGDGLAVNPGDKVVVHYTGRLSDGTIFDNSNDRGTPFIFNLGAREVIPGWDLGLIGMKIGGTRKLTIPASMGYGNRSAGKIPPNSTLFFEIVLLGKQNPWIK